MKLFVKSVSGIIWASINSLGVQVINLIVQIALARILDPKVFGIMALLQIFFIVGIYLMEGGMNSSLIRMKEPKNDDFSTVFFTNLVFSLAIYLVVFCISPFIAEFYGIAELDLLIKIFAISFVIRSFLIRSMKFKKLTFIELPSLLVSGVSGIFFAINGYGIWSLVYMNIIQSLVYTFMYWITSSWRPDFIFKKDLFRYHFDFGFKISITNVFNALFDNIYNIIIGKFYSISQLSFYNRAEQFQLLPGRILSSTLEKVTYPMFAELQDKEKELLYSYRTLLVMIFYWLSPIMILISIAAKPIFRFLLTDKWDLMIPFFQILLIAGIFNPMQRFNLNILRIKNKPGMILRLNFVKRIIFALAIVLTFRFGLDVMVWAQSISYVISFLIIEYYVGKEINYSLLAFIKDIMPTMILISCWSIIAFCIYLYTLNEDSNILYVGIFIILLFMTYILSSFIFKNHIFFETKKLVLKFIKR
ncbi:lipopolysaccharide biosynthesis protein [Chryseobacterium taichungense]|uniref:lipopolysaccharide biosynthesis protein n=1 Tax=Chryseobacterium taichungense TaxID=295069 RepID=UPI0028B1E65F|nr:lipopolysaccharide biosynthesis protein [Chryseobacterium taichungense]